MDEDDVPALHQEAPTAASNPFARFCGRLMRVRCRSVPALAGLRRYSLSSDASAAGPFDATEAVAPAATPGDAALELGLSHADCYPM